MNQAIFDRYAELYPAEKGWQFALCCWKGTISDETEPMMWWFEPNDETTLFLPGLDAHDGRPPVLDAMVDVDHTLVVGSTFRDICSPETVYFTDEPGEELAPFVSKYVGGTELHGQLPNGDWRFAVKDFNNLTDSFSNGTLFERVSPLAA